MIHECPECDKKFSSRRCMTRHKNSHEGKRFTCPTCSRSFARKDYLKHRMYRMHIKPKSKSVTNIVNNAGPSSIPCINKECEERFESLQERELHIARKHDDTPADIPQYVGKGKRGRGTAVPKSSFRVSIGEASTEGSSSLLKSSFSKNFTVFRKDY